VHRLAVPLQYTLQESGWVYADYFYFYMRDVCNMIGYKKNKILCSWYCKFLQVLHHFIFWLQLLFYFILHVWTALLQRAQVELLLILWHTVYISGSSNFDLSFANTSHKRQNYKTLDSVTPCLCYIHYAVVSLHAFIACIMLQFIGAIIADFPTS